VNALARCNATRPLLNLRKKRKDGMDRAGRRAERPGPNGLGSLNPSGPRHNRMEGRSLKWLHGRFSPAARALTSTSFASLTTPRLTFRALAGHAIAALDAALPVPDEKRTQQVHDNREAEGDDQPRK
jgi:hypothetical protein